jgi:hypothetical protein
MKKLTPTMINALDGMAFRLNTLGDDKAAVIARNSKGRTVNSKPTAHALVERGLIKPTEEPKKGYSPIWFVLTEVGQRYVEEHGLGKE